MSSTNFSNVSQKYFKQLKKLSDDDSLTPEHFDTTRKELVDSGDLSNDEFDSMAAKEKIKPTYVKNDFVDELKSRSERGLLTADVLNQAKGELAKYEGVSGEAFDETMAGQQIKPSNVRLDAFNEIKSLSKRRKLTPEILNQKKEELNKYAGLSPELFDSTMSKNNIKPSGSPMRHEFFDEMKKLSGEHKLTPEIYNRAKEELGKYEGVSAEKFDSAMKKNRIRTSNFTTAAPTSSPQEAAENVMYQREHGTGLGVLAAMQDPNYKVGSGSSLNQPARPVGPKSGRLRSMARRLKKSGNPYWKKAQYDAEQMRLGEPNIGTPESRKKKLDMLKRAAEEARRQDKAYADTKRGQSGSGSRGEEVVTSYRPKPSDTDLIEQASIPKRSFEQYMKELKAVSGGNRDLFGTE